MRKEKGTKAVKRIKHVEDHHDDCGESLVGLPPCLDDEEEHLPDINLDIETNRSALRTCYQCCDLFASAPSTPCWLQDVFHALDSAPDGIDVMESCGGEGRPSAITVRRQLTVGETLI